MTPHTILFLAANPTGTARRAFDREAREIQAELGRSGCRASFELVTRWAAEPLDLLRELRSLRPTVVHYSGHGRRSGLCLQATGGRAQVVSSAAIAETFGAAGASVKVVVLSACYRKAQADALLAHVQCVVGMSGAIPDDARRSFAIGFYGGLGERESVAAAYQQGRAAIQLEGLSNGDLPRLQVRKGVDAGKLVLADEAPLPAARGAPAVLAAEAVSGAAYGGPVEAVSATEATAQTVPSQAHNQEPTMQASLPDREVSPLRGLSVVDAPSPGPTRSQTRCMIVIKASLADFDEAVLARTLALLRQLTGDVSLQITDVEEGSVRLTVSLSSDAARKLRQLWGRGQLTELSGFDVQAISELERARAEMSTLVSNVSRHRYVVEEEASYYVAGATTTGQVALIAPSVGLFPESVAVALGLSEARRNAEDELVHREALVALRECLSKLSDETQEMVFLRFSTEKTFEEIAAHLGRTANAVQAQVSRALPFLRRCLKAKGFRGDE